MKRIIILLGSFIGLILSSISTLIYSNVFFEKASLCISSHPTLEQHISLVISSCLVIAFLYLMLSEIENILKEKELGVSE